MFAFIAPAMGLKAFRQHPSSGALGRRIRSAEVLSLVLFKHNPLQSPIPHDWYTKCKYILSYALELAERSLSGHTKPLISRSCGTCKHCDGPTMFF